MVEETTSPEPEVKKPVEGEKALSEKAEELEKAEE